MVSKDDFSCIKNIEYDLTKLDLGCLMLSSPSFTLTPYESQLFTVTFHDHALVLFCWGYTVYGLITKWFYIHFHLYIRD